MIRVLAALAALCALSGCGLLGPAQSDLETALQHYYAGEHTGAPDLAAARIESYEGCQPANGVYRCPVVFATGAGHVPVLIWIERESNGWRIRNIALNQRQPRSR